MILEVIVVSPSVSCTMMPSARFTPGVDCEIKGIVFQ